MQLRHHLGVPEQLSPELPAEVVTLLAVLPPHAFLLADLYGVLDGLRERDDLLHVDQDPAVVAVGLEADAPDVEVPLVQPHDRGGQLLGKVGGDEDDPDVLAEPVLVGLGPLQEIEDRGPGLVGVAALLAEQFAVDADGLLERHRGDHRGVADRLEFHVPAVLGTLQLDDDEVGVLVDAEEVDPPVARVPVAELLGDDQRVGRDDVEPGAESAGGRSVPGGQRG